MYPSAAMTESPVSACAIYQNAAHCLRGDGEKLSAISPLRACLIYEPKVGFVNEIGRGESVARAFRPQVPIRYPAQLAVDKRH
jgi:hypothetical protein